MHRFRLLFHVQKNESKRNDKSHSMKFSSWLWWNEFYQKKTRRKTNSYISMLCTIKFELMLIQRVKTTLHCTNETLDRTSFDSVKQSRRSAVMKNHHRFVCFSTKEIDLSAQLTLTLTLDSTRHVFYVYWKHFRRPSSWNVVPLIKLCCTFLHKEKIEFLFWWNNDRCKRMKIIFFQHQLTVEVHRCVK